MTAWLQLDQTICSGILFPQWPAADAWGKTRIGKQAVTVLRAASSGTYGPKSPHLIAFEIFFVLCLLNAFKLHIQRSNIHDKEFFEISECCIKK